MEGGICVLEASVALRLGNVMNIHHWVLFHPVRSTPAVPCPLVEAERKKEAKLTATRKGGKRREGRGGRRFERCFYQIWRVGRTACETVWSKNVLESTERRQTMTTQTKRCRGADVNRVFTYFLCENFRLWNSSFRSSQPVSKIRLCSGYLFCGLVLNVQKWTDGWTCNLWTKQNGS